MLRWSTARVSETQSLQVPFYDFHGNVYCPSGRFTSDQYVHDVPTIKGVCGSPYIVFPGKVAAIHMYGHSTGNGGIAPHFEPDETQLAIEPEEDDEIDETLVFH